MADDFVVLPPPPPVDPQHLPAIPFVSRAGEKLEAAFRVFPIDVAGKICADLGANVGGFTDCLLRRHAAKVYAVDTAYGVLAWTLRKDPRVVVKDRTNALHVRLPEPAQIIAIDVGWTRQEKILPHVATLLPPHIAPGLPGETHPNHIHPSPNTIAILPKADILTLIKPHYESEEARIQRGLLSPDQSERVLRTVMARIAAMGWIIRGIVRSPLEGQKGNIEFIAWLQREDAGAP